MKRYNTPEEYLEGHPEWQSELELLRETLLDTELVETVKWGAPIYTVNGKNVVGLGAFKSYVGIWFFQGVFLKDPKGVLINAQEGKTVALRQWRFENKDAINPKLIKSYVEEAIANQRAGLEYKAPRKKAFSIPEELKHALENDAGLKEKFTALTHGRQREYAEYIAEAKREGTRQKRLEKSRPMILSGVGLNDKYKNC